MTQRVLIILSVAVFSIGVLLAQAPNAPAPLPLTIENIGKDMYVVRGDGGNTTVCVTDEGVILVDVKFERNFDDLMAKIKSVTDRPVKYVIDSHSHGDHTGGNQKMISASAVVIAHKNTRDAMVAGKAAGLPQITYTDQLALHLGGKEIIVKYFGLGHTAGDSWVFFPETKILSTGDGFATGDGRGLNPTHAVATWGVGPDGSFKEATNTLDKVLKENFDIVVPGHGPMATRADLVQWRSDIDRLRTRMAVLIREGKSKEDIQKMLVTEFSWDPNGNMLKGIDSLINELKRQD